MSTCLLEESEQMIQRLRDPSTQLVFVSATVPRDIKNILEGLIDCDAENFSVINTKTTNKLMCHVPQKFLRLSTEKRNNHMLELVRKELENRHQKRTIMIFSHRTSTAVFASKFLEENGKLKTLNISGVVIFSVYDTSSKFFPKDHLRKTKFRTHTVFSALLFC